MGFIPYIPESIESDPASDPIGLLLVYCWFIAFMDENYIMNGQWVGTYNDTAEPSGGFLVVNIDELSSYFHGFVYLFPKNNVLPPVAVIFRTLNKNKDFSFRTSAIFPINPINGAIDSWDNIKLEDVHISKFADVTGSWNNRILSMKWTTEYGVKGACSLPRSKASEPSKLKSLKKNWKKYKEYVLGLEGKRFLFRGQSGTWRLRTSYHRTGRADLNRFLLEDIPALHRHLSGRTKHIFNLDIPNENGAFLNLIQHHGYPTPLLDWSRSPYVAAYFAYRNITNEKAVDCPKDKVRILVFDQVRWLADWEQTLTLRTSKPHVSVCEFMAIENERLVPQQAVSTVTNIDDIESHILSKENKDRIYLWAIDLPMIDRNLVVEELRYMGITAGALFPGLDGACQELKERNFNV